MQQPGYEIGHWRHCWKAFASPKLLVSYDFPWSYESYGSIWPPAIFEQIKGFAKHAGVFLNFQLMDYDAHPQLQQVGWFSDPQKRKQQTSPGLWNRCCNLCLLIIGFVWFSNGIYFPWYTLAFYRAQDVLLLFRPPFHGQSSSCTHSPCVDQSDRLRHCQCLLGIHSWSIQHGFGRITWHRLVPSAI